MDRKAEILKLFDKVDGKNIILKSVDEMMFLEKNLTEFKKVLNETHITPKTKEKYKFYHSLYKDNLNQYTQLVKTLCSILNKEEGAEDSPLRAYFNKLQGDK